MSFKKWIGLMASASVVGVVALVGNGCSSSSSPAAAGDDGSADVIVHHEAASGDDTGTGDDGSTTTAFDGTTGKACKADADCKGTGPNAPGTNVCSNKYGFKVTNVSVSIWPTPVCIGPLSSSGGNCDPGIDNNIHFCDGPDAPTSPGICLPNTTPPQTGNGSCYPKCTVPLDGSATTGCTGNDKCVSYTYVLDPTNNNVTGFGFCQGACDKDADCTDLGAGYICQVDIGFCTKAAKQTTRTKTIGQGCTGGNAATSDNTTGACNCVANNTSNLGYCTSACVIGSSVTCPDGYVCDGFYPTGPLNFGDASAPALTKQNTGTVGTCIQPCTTVDGGTSADGGPQCPTNSTCQLQTLVGPDCLP